MVQFYIMMILRGTITVDDVPARWHDEVRKVVLSVERPENKEVS